MEVLGAMRDEEQGLVAPVAEQRRSDFFLFFCRLLSLCSLVSALLCMTAHAMALVVGPSFTADMTAALDQSLRLYGIGLSALLILVETDWQRFMAYVRIFDRWIIRALSQTFLAVLTLSVAVSDGNDDFHRSLQLYRKISGLCMISCAVVYLCGGIMCFGYIKQAKLRRSLEMGQLHSTLQSLEKKEKEIRRTIARHTSV